MYRLFVKRLLDIVLSAMGIVIFSPVYLLIGLMVRIQMGAPVLFSQERIGKDEKPLRMTKFGKLLRSSSLDELPELWCIFTGKMSFVGPRPLPTYYGPYFLPEERKRHTVRGGLIPPDSLSGKTYTTYEEQFAYECYYAEHLSFLLDIKVIYTTFRILWGRVTTGYGAQMDRPHLNVYRKDMDKME